MLKEKIEKDLLTALKAKEALKVSCLRLIKAAIKNKEIDLRGEIQEPQLLQLLSTLAKQRQESITLYKQGGRKDLAEKESKELTMIESYLPKALSDEELLAIVEAAVAESGAKNAQEMGKVMKIVMPQVTGRADGKKVQELVKEKLRT